MTPFQAILLVHPAKYQEGTTLGENVCVNYLPVQTTIILLTSNSPTQQYRFTAIATYYTKHCYSLPSSIIPEVHDGSTADHHNHHHHHHHQPPITITIITTSTPKAWTIPHHHCPHPFNHNHSLITTTFLIITTHHHHHHHHY